MKTTRSELRPQRNLCLVPLNCLALPISGLRKGIKLLTGLVRRNVQFKIPKLALVPETIGKTRTELTKLPPVR